MDVNDFVKKIHKKAGKAVKYKQLFDIITIINNYLYEEMVNDRPIYIDKFGVFTQMVPNSKKVWSKSQNKIVMSSPTKKLIFRPHESFRKLIKLKKASLQVAENSENKPLSRGH